MADLAAAHILAGVGKSGSPTLRLITSKPAARSSAAYAVMVIVADGAILPILSEKIIFLPY